MKYLLSILLVTITYSLQAQKPVYVRLKTSEQKSIFQLLMNAYEESERTCTQNKTERDRLHALIVSKRDSV